MNAAILDVLMAILEPAGLFCGYVLARTQVNFKISSSSIPLFECFFVLKFILICIHTDFFFQFVILKVENEPNFGETYKIILLRDV